MALVGGERQYGMWTTLLPLASAPDFPMTVFGRTVVGVQSAKRGPLDRSRLGFPGPCGFASNLSCYDVGTTVHYPIGNSALGQYHSPRIT